MNYIEDFSRRICKDTKYRSIREYLDSCKRKLPLTVYMGKKLLLTPEQIKELTSDEIEIAFAKSNRDEEYNYIAIRHKVVVSKNDFIHFNPFKPIWVTGGGKNKQEYDPRYIFDCRIKPSEIIAGGREISYRVLPVEVKIQFGCLFIDFEDEKNWMTGIVEELQSEIEENDKNFYEVGVWSNE